MHYTTLSSKNQGATLQIENDASPYGDMMHLLRKYDVAPLRSAMMRCLPQCAVRHTSLGVAVIIGVANIICRRQTSFKKRTFVLVDKSAFFAGGATQI